MDIQKYLATILSKIGHNEYGLTKNDLANKLAGLIHTESSFNKPNLLGAGAESRVWDLSPNNVLKVGPDFYNNNQGPMQDIMPKLEGRLEPKGVVSLDRGGNVPQAAHVFPRAESYTSDNFPYARDWGISLPDERMETINDELTDNPNAIQRKIARVLKAAIIADNPEEFNFNPKSIFAKSYEPYDLQMWHPYNVGHTADQGLVSIDSSAGLAPVDANIESWEYPRRGSIVGKNILGRWADEVLDPKAMPDEMEAVRRRLGENPYPRSME